MRSVAVPVTGQINVWGRERDVSGPRPRRSALAQRYAVVYDTSGPKVTLGVLWFLLVIAALTQGWAPTALVFGVAAGWAALETAQRQAEVGAGAEPRVAGVAGAVVATAAAAGAAALGGAILLAVIAAVVAAVLGREAKEEVMTSAAATVAAAVPWGLAAGCVVLARDLEIGAAVVLVLFVSAYELGDYLIGSGASNSVEGPVVGVVTIAVTAMAVAALRVPPFDGAAVFTFAGLAAVACPAGQLAASALLPAADAHAPAARRLDSLLLLAPFWVFTTGLFIASQA